MSNLVLAGTMHLCISGVHAFRVIHLGEGGGHSMSTVESFFLGIMAAWTPSLILLAWLLWRDAGSQDEFGDAQH